MRDSLAVPVLVLNRSYQPIRITTARDAFGLLYGGRARAVDEDFEHHDFERWRNVRPRRGDDIVGTPGGPVRVPRVLMVLGYSRVPRTTVRLSRRNLFLRDAHTCQYCARTLPPRDLNLDHVVPRSRGGRSTWENLVTSCRDCNLRKGGQVLDESGMRLRRRPFRPNWNFVVQLQSSGRRFGEWEPFLPIPTAVGE